MRPEITLMAMCDSVSRTQHLLSMSGEAMTVTVTVCFKERIQIKISQENKK